MTVFSRFATYGYIHHRALNNPATLATAQRDCAAYPGVTHIFEGDVCWNFTGARHDLYFRHPSYIFDSLSAEAIDAAVAQGALIRADDLAALVPKDVFLVIELKVGRGPWRVAIENLLDLLDRDFAGRYWIDGFSLALLGHVKAARPDGTVTLHSEYVSSGKALVMAPDSPLPRWIALDAMPQIDGVAIRWHRDAHFMERAAADVRRAGKTLLISRIHNFEQYRLSRLWQAKAGYIHGDFAALMQFEAATFGHAANAVENRAVAE
jgi:hypothetical protein